ncbi:hypothetical protein [Paraconexibacter algicola]|uniref:Translocation/assembly module TamB n=1 Tax=Paraconexibacter algicola TaxID=2133960 RepID=A0A2T4UI02_9ACTN|nr:hypothetical protein [Paraconexibacter algicola]PTL58871.1 hypothetical protein C7Y72_03995 [Paraconexibacter algicola]
MRAALVASVAVAAPLAAAPAANAGLLGGLLGPVVTTTNQTVNQTTTATSGLVSQTLGATTTLVNGVVCPTVGSLSQQLATVPGLGNGLGAIGSGLTSLTCASSLLHYEVVTRYKRPNGTILTRSTPALIGVPAALNVDDEALADLNATLTLTSLNTIGLKVNRDLLKSAANLPVSVEVVVSDTSTRILGRRNLSFGYDATADQAPGGFTLETPLDTITRPGGDFRVTLSQTLRRNRIKLIAGLFDGTSSARVNPTEVSIDYGASPDTATIVARAGSDLAATLTTNRPGPTTVAGRVVDGTTTDAFDAQITNLPGTLSIAASTAGGTRATYSASARVATIDATLQRTENGVLRQKTKLNLADVPTGLTATVAGDDVQVATTGGPLGLAKLGQANGEPKFLPDTEPAYVYSDDDGTLRSVSAKIPGLQSATARLSGTPTVSAKLASTPLLARIVDTRQRIDARVKNVPAWFDASLDLDNGRLTYDGHGTGIGRIELDAVSTTPFFGRATKLKGTLVDLPSSLDARIETANGKGGITLDRALGRAEIIASNGPETLPAGGGQGAIYRDLPGGEYLVSARVDGIRKVAFDTTGAPRLSAVTAGGPFSVALRTDALDVAGDIRDLPADVDLGFDLDGGRLTFEGKAADGSPRGIGQLDLTAADPRPGSALIARATRIQGRVKDIPASLDLRFDTDGDDLSVDASNAIGSIELVAANRAIDFRSGGDLPADDRQGATLVDRTGGTFAVGARILGLKSVSAALGQDLVRLRTHTRGGPFDLAVDTDDLTGTAQVRDLPAKLDTTLDLPNGKVTVVGRDADDSPATIERLDVALAAREALLGRAKYLDATVKRIPADLVLDIAQDGEGARLEANEPIGSAEVIVSATPPDRAADLPAGDEQGAKVVDTATEFTIAARIREFEKVAARVAGDVVRVGTKTEGGPFSVRFRTDELNATGRIENLPKELDATLDLPAGKLTVDGHGEGIDRVLLDAVSTRPLLGRATAVRARVEGLAPLTVVDLAQAGNGARVEANEPIGLVEVAAADTVAGLADALPADDDQGAVLLDTPVRYAVGARVRGLKKVVALLDDTVTLVTRTASGPFTIKARTADLDADARIADLPSALDATLDLDGGALQFDNSDVIDEITLKAIARTGTLLGRATRVEGTIRRLAKRASITIDPAAPSATVDADSPIEEVSILATDLPEDQAAPAIADGEQGAIYQDKAGQPFVLAARLLDLRRIGLQLDGQDVDIDARLRSTPFSIDATTDDLTATARIDKLPARTSLGFDLQNARFTYAGRNDDDEPVGVDEISFSARSDQPIFDRARKLQGRLTDVPSDLTVGLDSAGNGATVAIPDGQALGDLELHVADDVDAPFPLTEQGVRYHDTADDYGIAVKVTGLKKLAVGLDTGSGIGLQIDRTAGSRFVADVDVDGLLTAVADIADLPASAELAVDLDGSSDNPNALTFKGRDENGDPVGIQRLTLSAESDEPILGGGRYIQGDIERLPSDVALSFSQANGRATVKAIDPNDPDADGTPVGKIELAASDEAGQFTYPTSEGQPAQGAVLRSKPGEPFRVGIRVLELRELSVQFDEAISLKSKTAGGPFVADVSTEAFAAQAKILDLPQELTLDLDLQAGEVRYTGSAPIGQIFADIDGREPLFLGATGIEVDLRDVPQAFTLGLGTANEADPEATDLSGIKLTADQPIGSVNIRARSRNRSYPVLPAGTAGAIIDATLTDEEKAEDPTQEQLALALRVFQLKRLEVNLAPLVLKTEMQAGRVFTVDAKLPQTAEDGTPRRDLEVAGTIDRLPAVVELGLGDNLEGDTVNGSKLMLKGSEPIDLVKLSTRGLELLEGADAVEAEIENLPVDVDVTLPDQGDLARVTARDAQGQLTPIGQLRLAAGSGTANLPADDYDAAAGGAGTLNDLLKFSQTSGFDIRTRLSGVRSITLDLDPVKLRGLTNGGKKLDIDAEVPLEEGGAPVSVKALVDSLPSDLTLELGDNPGANGPNGTRLQVLGNARIGLVTLDTSGLELLPGASVVQAALHDLPLSTTITIPEEGSLATIAGLNGAGQPDPIGQIRLAAHGGSGTLPQFIDPASPIPGTVTQATASNDLLKFATDPANFGIALRLTGAKVIDVNLEPVALQLQQDPAKARPITIDAAIPAGTTVSDVDGLINRPGASTKLFVNLSNDPSVPSSINFDNSQKLARLELFATNLGSIPSAKLAFDNVAPKLTACLDPGNGCRRPNPNVPGNTTSGPRGCSGGNIFNPCSGPPQDKIGNRYNANGNGRPYKASASLNFDDQGSLGTGTAATDFTTFRAKLKLTPTDPEIKFGDPDTNAGGLTFKTFSLDLGTGPANTTISSFGQNLPLLYMFFDSRNAGGVAQPFVMDGISYPPLVNSFNVGTQASKATASARFVWARGDGSIVTAPASTSTGSLACGGRRELLISTGLGNINVLNVLGLNFALLPVCSS